MATEVDTDGHGVAIGAGALILALLVTVTALAADQGQTRVRPEPARVAELASMLSRAPQGVGRPINDRGAWDAIAKAPGFDRIVRQAGKLLSTPIPELTDDLYLDFSRTGNRTRCQRVLSRRHSRVSVLVLAECLENQGRFLSAIEQAVRAVCGEKTWVLPAHDRSLRNFRGETNEIDLAVAGFSWELATAYYWLGQRLSAPTRELMRRELERRTLQPLERAVKTGQPRLWWLTGTNNWNAVCLAGVTGCALTMIDSPERRAFFVATAERSVQNFLDGFTPDGYCSEGIGYWNYGFGHFVLLTETVRQATDGKLDLMASPEIEPMARFGRRMAVLPGVYPAFADCGVGTVPSSVWMAYLSRRFQMGLVDIERQGLLLAAGPTSSLVTLGVMGFPNSASRVSPAADVTPALPVRNWFPDAGILVCRPGPGNPSRLGVAMKGGHNAEHHNHNDVGSYMVAVGSNTPLLDPGSEVYTARTFSSRRYESRVLNSFGHPVPRVAGTLQRTGRAAAAKVLKTSFTDEVDTMVLDLRAAYAVPELERLQRTFVYSRKSPGSLTVVDQVQFSSPQDFGIALITFSKWKQIETGRLLVGDPPNAVQVQIETDGPATKLDVQEIKEDLHGHVVPTRLGIDLAQPVSRTRITLTITPGETEP